MAGLAMLGCADSAPTSGVSTRDAEPSLSGSGSDRDSDDDRGRSLQFKVALRAANEIPVSTSLSRGEARIRIPPSGPIRSILEIDNRGNEVIRFCHIHWIDPSITGANAGTGPVIWFLTPTGVAVPVTGGNPLQGMQLVTQKFLIGQDADYVTNNAFGADNAANEATARAALIADPSKFYVNCHSNAFAPGFVRGNLPGRGSHH
jgi:hypothetical protein